MNNIAYEKVGERLRPEHLYDPAHARIYAAIETLITRGQIADPRTLRGMFENDPALAAVGGANYLADLVASVVTIINTEKLRTADLRALPAPAAYRVGRGHRQSSL